jgi:Ca2+-binding EF-hand superfamily protein
LHDTFDLIDENGDNSLSQTEIQHAMIMLGHHVSHKSLKTIVEAVNGGKDLSFSDFVAINAARMKVFF